MSFWYKTTSHTLGAVGKYTTTNGGWILFPDYSGVPKAFVRSDSVVTGAGGTTQLDTGNYYHLAMTAKNGGKLKVFVNGEKVGEIDLTHSFQNNVDHFYIGYYVGNYLDGEIADVKIYSTEKPEGWVKHYYNATKHLY